MLDNHAKNLTINNNNCNNFQKFYFQFLKFEF